ncbi:hypothetical protein NQ315_016609 [Exocentrus adspersus]|uniref:Reverse transcriptase zinc-binding domain-containing protein n=1 Tax=Exocentrus adspersus TaxID=1586481 RepID=A0AAV8VNW5_9CUCU|nr:hypothetical protein NQ315_016609 [Exocentrus adspersus]
MGIPGNGRADQLARLGSGEPPQGPEPILGISRGSINGTLSRWAYRRLGMSWRMNTGCRQAHNFLDGPDMSKTVWLLNLGRRALNQMVGILTGHCRSKRHLHLMGIEKSPLCPECGEGEDTPIHLLAHCIAFGRLRLRVSCLSVQPSTEDIVLVASQRKSVVPGLSITQEQMDRLAEIIIRIHGVDLNVQTEENLSRINNLKLVIANVNRNIDEKLEERRKAQSVLK